MIDPQSYGRAQDTIVFLDNWQRELKSLAAQHDRRARGKGPFGFASEISPTLGELARLIEEWTPPPWSVAAVPTTEEIDPLRVIVPRIHALIAGRIEIWRDAVLRWASDPKHMRGDDGALPIPFVNEPPLTRDERMVLLAAIYDTYAAGLEKICPWPDVTASDDGDLVALADVRQAMPYTVVLLDRIPKLREEWGTYGWEVASFLTELEREFSTAYLQPPQHMTSASHLNEGVGALRQKSDDSVSDLKPQEKALALLVKHPDWSDTKIAKAVGVSRTTLYKPSWAMYQKARQALQSGRRELPSGAKDRESGGIEAWDSDGEDDDAA